MKKLVSLVLAMVLMASMFAMLGSFTASAETYDVTKTLVNLTFDGDAPYGIVGHRGNTPIYVAGEDGYLKVTQPNSNGAVFFLGKDGTVGRTVLNMYPSNLNLSLDDVFFFEANKTYRVSFDYKYLAGTGKGYKVSGVDTPSTGSNNSLVRLFSDPRYGHTTEPNSTDGYDFEKRVNIISQTPPSATWTPDPETGLLAEDTEWMKAEYIFSTKEDETGFAWSMHPGSQGDTIAAYDNIKIEEVVGSYSYTETDVYTMEDKPFATMAGANGSISYDTDAEKGDVAVITGENGGRVYIPGTPRIKANTKYYVSFDAKGIANGNYLNLGMGRATNAGACRIFIMGFNDYDRGGKLYIDGVETPIKDGFTNVTTEWQSYGFVIDTANETFLEEKEYYESENKGGNVFTEQAYFFFGAQYSTVYFDNVKIVEISGENIVATEKDDSAKYSIRKEAAGVSAGLRFKGDVAANVKAAADEIGFVVAPVELLVGDANWYKLDSLNKNAKTTTAYVKDGKDVVYAEGQDAVSYQLILTNLGTLTNRRFAAVMYVKTGDAYSYISLGEMSYNQVLAEYAVRGY